MDSRKKLPFLLDSSREFELNCLTRLDFLNPSFILLEYFKFFYCIAQCPFKFVYSHQLRSYTTYTNIFQKLCCFVLNICLSLNLISYLRWYAVGASRDPGSTSKKELLYFSIGLSFGEAITGVSYFITIWFYAPEFEKLINFYHIDLKHFNMRRTTLNNYAKEIVLGIFGIGTILCQLITLGLNVEETATLHDDDVTYLLFLDLISYNFNSDLSKIIKKFILIGTQLLYYSVYFANEALLISAAIAMLIALNKMEERLPLCSVNDGVDYYYKLKILCSLNDTALNLAIFGGVFGQILAIAFSVPKIFQPPSTFEFFVNLMHGTVGIGYLTIASLIVTKSSSIFEDWVIGQKKFKEMSENQLGVLLYSLSQQEISISTVGLVKLTPGFLGAILGLVFTFSIVIIQFNQTT